VRALEDAWMHQRRAEAPEPMMLWEIVCEGNGIENAREYGDPHGDRRKRNADDARDMTSRERESSMDTDQGERDCGRVLLGSSP
jgi:hypothetical protein